MATKSLVYVIMGRDQLTPVMRKAGKESEVQGGRIGKSFAVAGKAMAGMGLLGVAALGACVNAARNLNLVPLEQATKNAGIAWAQFKPKVDSADKSMEKLGFTGGETNAALTRLMTVTRSQSMSLKSLSVVADLARYRHISLGEATDAYTRALAGNTRGLRILGISTNDLPKNFAKLTMAQREQIVSSLMSARVHGQAAAYAQTFGGRLAVLRAQTEGVAARIGQALLPILSNLIAFISATVVPWLEKFSAWFKTKGIPLIQGFARALTPFVKGTLSLFVTGISTIVGWVGKLPGPAKLAVVAISGMTIAMHAFNTASRANWVGLIVTGIILLVGACVKYWPQISGFFRNIGKVVASVAIIVLGTLRNITNGVLTFVGTMLHGIATAFGWVPGLGGKLRGASQAFDGFKAGVNKSFDGMINSVKQWQKSLDNSKKTSAQTSAQVIGHLNGQVAAAGRAKGSLDRYSAAIAHNGVSSAQAKSARQQLIDQMNKAGVNAEVTRRDVDRYTSAVRSNGANSDAARAARLRLNADIANARAQAQKTKADTDKLTGAVRAHGSTSDAAKRARAQLIADFMHSGMNAHDATGKVDGLIGKLSKVPPKVETHINVLASAAGKITAAASGMAKQVLNFFSGFAFGGMVPGNGRPTADDRIVRVSSGEYVVQADSVSHYGVGMLNAINAKKYAKGGPIGIDVNKPVTWTDAVTEKFMETYASKAMRQWVSNFQAAFMGGGGSGGQLAQDATKWNGHRYVWGGGANPQTGWDCSSFSSFMLGTHGFPLPGGFRVPSLAHGPSTLNYISGYGTHVPYNQMQPGDLYVNSHHMGIVVGPGKGFAARSTATGTGYQGVPPGAYTIVQPPGLGRYGNVGNVGNVGSVSAWAGQMLRALGMNVIPGAVNALVHWAQMEGGHWNNAATYNPLNTTYREPGSHSINSVGVQAYTSWNQGIAATANTLSSYSGILAALRVGDYAGVGSALLRSPWGTTNWAKGGLVSYDRGGPLKPGYTLAYNGTGRDEWVSNGRGGGDTYNVTVNVQGHALASKQEIGRTVSDAMQHFADHGGKLPSPRR